MFPRKMPRSNSHLTELSTYHSTMHFLIAAATTVRSFNAPLSFLYIANRAPKFLLLVDVLRKVAIPLIAVRSKRGSGERLETKGRPIGEVAIT
jgi:hypothetical protein